MGQEWEYKHAGGRPKLGVVKIGLVLIHSIDGTEDGLDDVL